jgi:integrase
MTRRRGHGEGGIYQRSDGLWCAAVDLGIVNGKRRRKVIYGKTRKEVADKLKALHRDQSAGINIAPDQYTVEEFIDRWLAEVICHRRPRTRESYEGTARLHIIPHVGHHRLTKLLPEHVQSMMNALTASGLSPRTVEYACLVLSRALNQAVKWGYVPRNVATLAEKPRPPKHKVRPLDDKQARALLDAVRGHRLQALYLVALSLGLRRGEILGLRWEDINFERRMLAITGSLQRQNKRLERSAPKTDAGNRVLPLPAQLAKALEAHRQRQDAERTKAGDTWQEYGLVFTTATGLPIEPRNLFRHFKKVLVKAKLPPETRFHDLRHSCATLLIAQGVHARVVMEILGHSQISLTMNLYGHVLEDTHRQAADKLDALLDPGDETDEDKANDAGAKEE